MKTTEFNKSITSSQLQENLEKQFGSRVNLEKYDREQLEDIRNKLRTRIFQQEGSAGINDLLTNETYQKDKAMLELLNTRIKEMLGEDIKKLRDKMTELSEAKKGVKAPKYTKKAAGSKPDFPDIDNDGNKKEKMKDAASDKKAGPQKGVNPFAKKDTKVKEGKAHPSSCKCNECMMKEEPNEGNAYGNAVRNTPDGEEIKINGKSTGDIKKEGFPTVDDAKKAAAGTAGMKTGEKKKSSTGGTITKVDDKTIRHAAGKNYGGPGSPKTPDSDKRIKEDSESKTGKKKCPPMSHIKKMCQDGKSVKEICKMHPDCDQSELKQMVADCKEKMVKESQFKHNVRFVNESLDFLLQEDEEGKAKAITAAGDIVNDYTSWMQRVGQYQTKTMIELADAIKADFGAAEAEQFKQAVGPALSATLDVLTQQREAVSNAVATLAGEAAPEEPMGMEPDMDQGMDMPPEPGVDAAGPDEMNPDMGDEFGAADAAAGGPETSGRAMRESQFARRLAESHSIMSKLAK
jgi:hypothetical protein